MRHPWCENNAGRAAVERALGGNINMMRMLQRAGPNTRPQAPQCIAPAGVQLLKPAMLPGGHTCVSDLQTAGTQLHDLVLGQPVRNRRVWALPCSKTDTTATAKKRRQKENHLQK